MYITVFHKETAKDIQLQQTAWAFHTACNKNNNLLIQHMLQKFFCDISEESRAFRLRKKVMCLFLRDTLPVFK